MRSAGQYLGQRFSNELVWRSAEPAEFAAVEEYSENGKPLCIHELCDREARTRRLCQNHYMQLRRREWRSK